VIETVDSNDCIIVFMNQELDCWCCVNS